MNSPLQTRGLAVARLILSVAALAILGLVGWLLSPGDSGSTEASVIASNAARQVVNQIVAAPLGAATGSIKGTVKFKGKIPDVPPKFAVGSVPANKDGAVCGAMKEIVDDSLVINPKNSGIQHVFVYLRTAPAGYRAPPVPKKMIDIDQANCTYIPHTMLVRATQVVNVMNDDMVAHNVHTIPGIRNIAFNQIVAPKTRQGTTLTYRKPEKLPVEVKCDIHPWMKAYQLVLDHPFMAVTDTDGNFEIKDLPAGNYEFIVWQERSGYLQSPSDPLKVSVAGGDVVNVPALEYEAQKLSAFFGPQPRQVIVAEAD